MVVVLALGGVIALGVLLITKSADDVTRVVEALVILWLPSSTPAGTTTAGTISTALMPGPRSQEAEAHCSSSCWNEAALPGGDDLEVTR
jgi:hypothetical protein